MKRLLEFLNTLAPVVIIVLNFLFILFLGLIDYLTGFEFSFSIFYLLPIAITTWYAGRMAGNITSLLSAIVWFAADITGGHIYSSTFILIWNTLMRLSLFLIISNLLTNLRLYLHKYYQDELLLQKNKNIIETSQKMTSIISENITKQNSEIIKWVNRKKSKGENVPENVDKASQIIGLSMERLSEISFLYPYIGDSADDADAYLDLMKSKLSQIHATISPEV